MKKKMKFYPRKFARNMLLLTMCISFIVVATLLLDRSLEVNDCQHNRNTSQQTFDQCMVERGYKN